jgi:RNA-directed DNA polymerase
VSKGMPLGNLTSQFFANIYLNKLDNFIKRRLRAKYYVRYVDDFVILHTSKKTLRLWMQEIDNFLKDKLRLKLHPDKSKIIFLPSGIDFVGFRNFYHFKLLRKRSIRKMIYLIENYREDKITKENLLEIFHGWQAHAKWANTFKLRKSLIKKIYAKDKFL